MLLNISDLNYFFLRHAFIYKAHCTSELTNYVHLTSVIVEHTQVVYDFITVVIIPPKRAAV